MDKVLNWVYENEMRMLFMLWIMIATVGCSAVYAKYNLKDDNMAEEIVESVIEAKTGLDLDLTPNSPENK